LIYLKKKSHSILGFILKRHIMEEKKFGVNKNIVGPAKDTKEHEYHWNMNIM